MDTKSKILKCALELFNSTNTQAATTNHISKKMNISPGNLHYHYKNREEIIRELYKNMQREYTLLPHEFPNTINELFEANEKSFKIQYKYRFFYRELLFLLSRDTELKQIYAQDAIAQRIRYKTIFERLSEKEILTFKNSDEINYLIDMILLIEQFWSSFTKIYGNKNLDIDTAIKQIEKLIQPFETKELS
jgi:AcrR family transcriptional regulator